MAEEAVVDLDDMDGPRRSSVRLEELPAGLVDLHPLVREWGLSYVDITDLARRGELRTWWCEGSPIVLVDPDELASVAVRGTPTAHARTSGTTFRRRPPDPAPLS